MKNKIKTDQIQSAGIRAHFGLNVELEILGSTGEGDNKLTLYRSTDGKEVIETNGDPVWDTEEGFAELRGTILPKVSSNWVCESRSMTDGSLIVRDADTLEEICQIRPKDQRHYGEQDRIDQARGVLLAAAPELLGALKECADWLCECEPHTDQWERGQKAKAAIAKAEEQ